MAGTDRLDTDLMRAAGKRLFAKVGAEGFYCAGIPSMRLGVALKVEDGAKRAAEPALLAVLRQIDAIDADRIRSPGEIRRRPKSSTPATKSSARLRISNLNPNPQSESASP